MTNTDAPQPSEWAEPDIEGECRIDLPMKSQVTDDLETEVKA